MQGCVQWSSKVHTKPVFSFDENFFFKNLKSQKFPSLNDNIGHFIWFRKAWAESLQKVGC